MTNNYMLPSGSEIHRHNSVAHQTAMSGRVPALDISQSVTKRNAQFPCIYNLAYVFTLKLVSFTDKC